MGQVFADVEHGRIEGCDVVCVPPVVPLTLGDVARFDVLGCFCCCCHNSAFADLLYNWSAGYRGGALIGGCRESHFLLRGLGGRCHCSQGKAMSPSEEPTTTKAERVVIVGYNKASLFLPAPRSELPRCAHVSIPFPSVDTSGSKLSS